MQSGSANYDVILLGFHQIQRTIISSLCSMSRKREQSYTIIANSDLFAADIILIDTQDQMVIQNWGQLKDVLGGIPVLLIGEEQVEGFPNCLDRSEIAGGLLDRLDTMTRESAVEPEPVEEIVIASVEPLEEDVIEDITNDAEMSVDEMASFGFVGADEQEPDFDFGHIDLNTLEENTIVLSGGIVDDDADGAADAAATTAAEAAPPPSAGEAPGAIANRDSDKVIQERLKRFHHESIVDEADSASTNRILVVDDSRTVWAQMRACLKGINADVDFVQTAENGIEQISRRQYSLVFMDVVLPGIDGYTACQQIKSKAESSHLPVIMLTTASTPANKVRGVLSGCSHYLTKPANMKEVQTVVSQYMGQGEAAVATAG